MRTTIGKLVVSDGNSKVGGGLIPEFPTKKIK